MSASFQLLPALTAEQYNDLRVSISEHGVLEPIVIDEYGTIIDGHHRKLIADKLGVPCPSRVVGALTDAEKRDYALTVNLDRRHLTEEQRAELHRTLRADGMKVREIAKKTGAGLGTVYRDLNERVGRELDQTSGRSSVPSGTDDLERERESVRLVDERPQPPGHPREHPSHSGAPPLRPSQVREQLNGHVPEPESETDTRAAVREAVRDAIANNPADEPEQEPARRVSRKQPRTAEEAAEDAAERFTRHMCDALITIWANLDPDPSAAISRSWRPQHNYYRGIPYQAHRFTAEGIREDAKLLNLLADHLDRTGQEL